MSRLPVNFSFNGKVAEKCGIVAALVFNRLDWSIDLHRTANETQYFSDGRWWMYDTIEDFAKVFTFTSYRTIKRALADLKDANLVFHKRIRKKDELATSYYAINYEEFEKLGVQNELLVPAVVYEFEVIEKLKFQIGTLPEKLRFQNGTEQGSNLAPASLSISLPSSPEISINTKGGNACARVNEGKPESVPSAVPPLGKIIQISNFKREPSQMDNSTKESLKLAKWEDDLKYWEGELLKEKSKGNHGHIDDLIMIESAILTAKQLILESKAKIQSSVQSVSMPQSNKNPPPEPEKDIAIEWHSYGSKTLQNQNYPLDRYKTAISQLRAKYSLSQITALFNFLKSSRDPLVSERFIFPWQALSPWRFGSTWRYIDEAFSSMNTKKRHRSP